MVELLKAREPLAVRNNVKGPPNNILERGKTKELSRIKGMNPPHLMGKFGIKLVDIRRRIAPKWTESMTTMALTNLIGILVCPNMRNRGQNTEVQLLLHVRGINTIEMIANQMIPNLESSPRRPPGVKTTAQVSNVITWVGGAADGVGKAPNTQAQGKEHPVEALRNEFPHMTRNSQEEVVRTLIGGSKNRN